MTGPQLTKGGQRVLAAASDLFYAKGIHAVGVDTIAATAGVTKKTLYDRFGSKDELVAAYLRARDERWRRWLTDATGHGRPAERLLASFDALDQWLREESPRGCSFLNALAELPDPAHPARAVITGQKRWLRDHLQQLAAPAFPQPRRLAERLLLLHEGAVAGFQTGAVSEPVQQAKAVAAELIQREAEQVAAAET
ncbi:TetR/AcrR family transcriptional regulator [Natronosporangium hydrolyticum]|uniref:TetR/AcrR family transcriptional regulator n=1 Tax=Natronosporangium hydrolyticum TaxID=2811111 RepID=A0A895YJ64_9ACTN|nr:TetR/AcrR family transcriptional regulator [Natronosporangium hydrolyticum]QSB15403.1 TetR/AcrR family transcriptional regulator [Natronosporangium hydrolyticum]